MRACRTFCWPARSTGSARARFSYPPRPLYAGGNARARGSRGQRRTLVQVAICAGIGLVTPPISSVSRGLWPRLLGDEQAQVVYGLEATAQELVFISGPAAVALIAGLASARTAVMVSGLIGLVGVLAYVTRTATCRHRSPRDDRRASGRVLFGTGVLRYATGGGLPDARLQHDRHRDGRLRRRPQASAGAGVVLAVWSLGSLIGGIWFGASTRRVTDRTLARVVTIAAAGLACAALAPAPVGAGGDPVLQRRGDRPDAGPALHPDGVGGAGGGDHGGVRLAGGGVPRRRPRSAPPSAACRSMRSAPDGRSCSPGCAALCAVPVIRLRRPVASSGG